MNADAHTGRALPGPRDSGTEGPGSEPYHDLVNPLAVGWRSLFDVALALDGHPDRIRQLFRLIIPSVIAAHFTGGVMVLAMWSYVPLAISVPWLAYVGVFVLLMFSQRNRGKTLRITRISRRTLRFQTTNAFLWGLPWGFATLAIDIYLPDNAQLVPLTALFVHMVGATIVYAVIPALVIVHNIGMVLPMMLYALASLDLHALYLAAVETILAGVLIYYSLYYALLIGLNERRARQREADMEALNRAYGAITELAETDVVTALLNRRAFHARLDAILAALPANATDNHALYLVDLDHFKHINDAYGHEVGDHYLRNIAERMRDAACDRFALARLGGDEFALISENALTPAQIEQFGQRLLALLAEPHDIDGAHLKGGCSIGVALAPQHSRSGSELLTFADAGLRTAKRLRRGTLVTFSADDRSHLQLRTMQALALEQAIAVHEVTAAFQPQIDMTSGRLIGFEALARWTMPGVGPVSPLVFFELAEERGLVLDLCDVVWQRIGDCARQWRAAGITFGTLSVNVHPIQVHHRQRLRKALDRLVSDVGSKDQIVLEITENCVIGRGMEEVPALLGELAADGFRISLDDFGTGYASLTQIKELPIHEVKIDRNFIRDLASDGNDRAIVRAIHDIAAPRQMTIVAEGVETEEQTLILRSIGRFVAQGYYYAKPMNAEDVAPFITRRQVYDMATSAVEQMRHGLTQAFANRRETA